MLYHNVRAANVRSLLKDGNLPEQLTRLEPAFHKAFRWDFRGTRLNDMLGLGATARMQVKELRGDAYLTHSEKSLLYAYLGGTPNGNFSVRLSLRILTPGILLAGITVCSLLRINGYNCRPYTTSLRDANVIIRGRDAIDLMDPSLPEVEDTGLMAAQILRILRHNPSKLPQNDTVLLIVRCYEPYQGEADKDPYRGFGFALAGCLFQKRYGEMRIARADDIICQFIQTDYEEPGGEEMIPPHVHVLPLVKVCFPAVPSSNSQGL